MAMLRSLVLTCGACSAALALASGAAAQVTLDGQQRSVSTTYTLNQMYWLPTSNPVFPDFDPPDSVGDVVNGPDTEAAPGFGAFDELIEQGEPSPLLDGRGRAVQHSSLGTEQVTATGSFRIELAGGFHALTPAPPFLPYNFGVHGTTGDSSSDFELTFSVSEATPFQLWAQVRADPDQPFGILSFAETDAFVRLTGPSGLVAEAVVLGDSECSPYPDCAIAAAMLDEFGVLPPGSYTLEASAAANGWTSCGDIGALTCFPQLLTGMYDLDLTMGPAAEIPTLMLPGQVLLGWLLAWLGVRRVGRSRAG